MSSLLAPRRAVRPWPAASLTAWQVSLPEGCCAYHQLHEADADCNGLKYAAGFSSLQFAKCF
eukprot:6208873-Pleurochrysis_carterae.AAC.12